MKCRSQILYIIGNGFDLHHNIKSSYCNFKKYIERVDNQLFELIDEYLQIEDNWSDFEEALSSVDIDTLTQRAGDFLVSYSAEDWSDAYHHDYQYEIEEVTRKLSFKLKQYFEEWLTLLKIPKKKDIEKKLLQLDKSAKYLTFNYTYTLQKTYKIKKSNVLHIHGALGKSKKIILGHNWNPANKTYLHDQRDPEDLDPRVSEGNEIIESYFRTTFKPTKEIIKNNKSFFSKLNKVRKIIIIGHSISQVDILYFKKISKNIKKSKVAWIVTYHTKNDKVNHAKQLKSLGISKKVIKFVKLNDLLKIRRG